VNDAEHRRLAPQYERRFQDVRSAGARYALWAPLTLELHVPLVLGAALLESVQSHFEILTISPVSLRDETM